MKIVPHFSDVPASAVSEALVDGGLLIDLGAMRVRIRSPIKDLVEPLRTVYGHYPFQSPAGFVDVNVDLVRTPGVRGLLRPGLTFLADGIDPFGEQPWGMTLPALEWGMNWCFSSLFNQHLLLHAGSLELNGHGLLLIGEPGSGKSTLTAALTSGGARCLSDEFGILRLADRALLPLPKPIALKNRSIDLIRSWSQDVVLGPTFRNTHKGDVAHMALPQRSVDQRKVPALPRNIVFPAWRLNAPVSVHLLGRAEAYNLIAHNSFNFTTTAEPGFDAVDWLVRNCACHRMAFGSLDDALPALRKLSR